MLNKGEKTKQNLQKRFLVKRVRAFPYILSWRKESLSHSASLFTARVNTENGREAITCRVCKELRNFKKMMDANLENHLKPELWGFWKPVLPICDDYMRNLIGLYLYFLGLLRIALPLYMFSLSFSLSQSSVELFELIFQGEKQSQWMTKLACIYFSFYLVDFKVDKGKKYPGVLITSYIYW